MGFRTERPASFADALALARRILCANHDLIRRGTIDAEAETIVAEAYRQDKGESLKRMELFARMKDRFPEEAGEKVMIFAHARAEGRLLQHVTGRQTFLEHDYDVNASVLVPRPETELLAHVAIEELHSAGLQPTLGLEIGLGSGILSIELLLRFSGLKMIASEAALGAVEVARANARRILGDESRLTVVTVADANEVTGPLARVMGVRKGGADFLISNPPYLHPNDPIDAEVRAQEPPTALYPKSGDPLYFYSAIAREAGELIHPKGRIFLELASERAREIDAIMKGQGWATKIYDDLNGFPRVLSAQRG